jgi:hypothetical protein
MAQRKLSRCLATFVAVPTVAIVTIKVARAPQAGLVVSVS